jgi:hypothetical protein
LSALTKISPEGFDVANGYLTYGTVDDTAEQMQIPRHEVVRILALPNVKRYLDNVIMDAGYRNRQLLGKTFDKLIEAKLEEASETGVYSSKDLADLLMMQHKMRMDEIKALKDAGPAVQVNQQNNFGDSNYERLMGQLFDRK